MMRVRRLLDNYETTEDPEMIQEIHKACYVSWVWWVNLTGITVKEELMFPDYGKIWA